MDLQELPVFEVKRPVYDPAQLEPVAKSLFADLGVHTAGTLSPTMFAEFHRFSTPVATLDIDSIKGAIWFQRNDFFQFSQRGSRPVPSSPETPPNTDGFLAVAGRFAQSKLASVLRMTLAPRSANSTRVVVWDHGTRTELPSRNLYKSFGFVLDIEGVGQVPAIGSGLKFGFESEPKRLGGRVTQFHWGGSVITGQRSAAVITSAEAQRRFAAMYPEGPVSIRRVELVYRLLDGEKAYLVPTWLCEGRATVGGKRINTGAISIPASEFEPSMIAAPAPGPFAIRSTTGAVDWSAADASLPRVLISWRGVDVALATSEVTVDALVQHLHPAWVCRVFDKADAHERDWHAFAAQGLEQANLAWYVGHADGGSIRLSEPAAEWLTCADVRFRGNVGCVVVDGCGPLQDTVTNSKTQSVFKRWASTFQGLHVLLGFGTPQTANSVQSPTALRYALDPASPMPIGTAWFRALREHQAHRTSHGQTWGAGMFLMSDGEDSALGDFLLTHGSVLPPPPDNGRLKGIWFPV